MYANNHGVVGALRLPTTTAAAIILVYDSACCCCCFNHNSCVIRSRGDSLHNFTYSLDHLKTALEESNALLAKTFKQQQETMSEYVQANQLIFSKLNGSGEHERQHGPAAG